MDTNKAHIPDLPGNITSITPQKRNKQRYSIFVNEAFLIGVDESTLIDFNLRKGVEMTPLLYQKLQRAEGRQKIKAYLLKLLGRRDHARKELWDKARRKDYPGDIVNGLLDELEQKGYIDDAGFAVKYAADKSNFNHWGPAKIRAHLMQKGVGRTAADRGIEQVFKDIPLKETLLELVLKRKRHFRKEENPAKRKKKVVDYLLRKGYTSRSVFNYVDELMKALEQ